VAALVAHAAIAGDIPAGRIDSPGELGKAGIDAAVDDADLDALAGRAGVVGRDGIGRDRIGRRLIFRRIVVGRLL
jgi:hypothetical protein